MLSKRFQPLLPPTFRAGFDRIIKVRPEGFRTRFLYLKKKQSGNVFLEWGVGGATPPAEPFGVDQFLTADDADERGWKRVGLTPSPP